MHEEQLTRLRSRLQRKKDRLEATTGSFFLPKLRRFWQFLNAEPFFTPVLEELQINTNVKTVSQHVWVSASNASFVTITKEGINALKTDEDLAAFSFHVLQGICMERWDFELINLHLWNDQSGNVGNYNTFKLEVVSVLCEYLGERLDEQQSILGLLVRYKKRCEWFNRRELLKTAQNEEAKKGDEKKRAAVEEVLKEDLYRYLHDQGMEFTIEPKSHRGEIDLILDQTGGDRKYLEGKVFDNENRDAKYIIKGFGQLMTYLRQYNALKGYLLVYKICEEQLVIEGANQLGTVQFVPCEGKNVFILVVDIHEYEKAVSQRVEKPIRITTNELVKADPTS